MSNKESSGRAWPYIIGGSITLVFGFCVATIVVTSKANLQESDSYMTYYQDADAHANKLIEARISFDSKYKIDYIKDGITQENASVKYKVTDLQNNPINNATLILATSRPETGEYNKKIENPKVENGIYTFNNLAFPKVGVWNLVAKVTVGDKYRFYNVKADTRIKEAFEF